MNKLKQMDWIVRYAMFEDPSKAVTVKEVMDKYGWTHGKSQRCLDRLVKHGYLHRREAAFWNGMYYAKRFYYW